MHEKKPPSRRLFLSSSLRGVLFFLLLGVDGGALREGDAEGGVEGAEAYVAYADAEPRGHQGAQELATPLGKQSGARQQIVSVEGLLQIARRLLAHLPDEVVGGLRPQPRLHDASHTEPPSPHPEVAPRALQLTPERHEAFLGVPDLNIHNLQL